jgi:N-acetylneuraminate epimerase
VRLTLLSLTLLCSNLIASEWTRLPSLPDREGFAGSFAGASNGALLVAGGANFPDKKPWEGGKKRWYDQVFVLEKPDGEWKCAGKLPRPLGYGISATYQNKLICVGGSDPEKHYADAFSLEWNSGQLNRTPLPSLPVALANACGTMVGDVLYVAGGQESPNSKAASNKAWKLNLSVKDSKWEELPPLPGSGRILPTAASLDGAFWIVGGAELTFQKDRVIRRYLKESYRYTPSGGWKQMADLPYSIVAAPSPAPSDAKGICLLGGDDGSQINVDPIKHRSFNNKQLRYEIKNNRWVESGTFPPACVTAPCVYWNGKWAVISGEVRPGIRSPEVWSFEPEQ